MINAQVLLTPITWLGNTFSSAVSRLNPNSLGFAVLTLIIALVSGVYQAASYYLAKDALPSFPWNRETFFEAIQTGDLARTRIFLQGGMSPEVYGDDRQLSMFLAMNQHNPEEVLNLLLKYDLDVNFPYAAKHAVGPQSAPMIQFAVLNENLTLVKALIRNGADVNVKVRINGPIPPQISTPLQLAKANAAEPGASDAAKQILNLLLDAGARQ
jgi:hypothetical protein